MNPTYRPLAYIPLICLLAALTGYYLGATLAILHNNADDAEFRAYLCSVEPDCRLRSFAAPALKGSIND